MAQGLPSSMLIHLIPIYIYIFKQIYTHSVLLADHHVFELMVPWMVARNGLVTQCLASMGSNGALHGC